MPAKSEAQRRFIYARFGADFAKRHGFDNPGKLPRHVKKKRRRGRVQADAVTAALAKGRP